MTESHTESTGDELRFDQASLDRLRRFGGGKLLGQMIDIFLETAPGKLDAARSGLTAGDSNAVEMALHSLKSSTAQLGAMRMQQLCEQGEREARAGSLHGTPGIVAALADELPQVISWLERARNGETS